LPNSLTIIELGTLFSDDDEYFAYYDPYNASQFYKATLDLETYIDVEGPFDAVLAFSHGAALVSTLLLGQKHSDNEGTAKIFQPFKCAVFLAAGVPWSLDALRNNELIRMDKTSKSRISIPTAHVWASNDPLGPSMSAVVEALCIPRVRHVCIHNEGHTVPGRRSAETLREAVNVIRRTIGDVASAST
jgi:pimeloyl-ACP methyl ester carboxylesterase